MVCSRQTGESCVCPWCGKEITTTRELVRRFKQAQDEIERLVREFTKEAEKARAERLEGSVFKRPQRHWGP